MLSNDQRGWILIFASAFACILGSLIIYLDVIWTTIFPKSKFEFRESPRVLVSSLSLSSGILLFTSLYRLLPEALGYFEEAPELNGNKQVANTVLITSYLSGIAICSAINVLIHAMTSQSVVHCSHDVDPQHSHTHFHDHHHHDHDDAHYGDNSQEAVHDDEATIETPNEYTGLLEGERDARRSMSIIDITYQKLRGKKSIGKCMGYSNIKDCLTNKLDGKGARLSETDAEEHESEDEIGHGSGSETVSDLGLDDEGHHHHHVSTRYTHLFSIGLQTALAISVHKIPEGFLTFATSHANPELGFSVFLALSIHNISEGFSIAFPLYLALGKRWLAILASIVLGGLSQPIGGILAWVLFKSKLNADANLTFGLLVSITAGFLSIIGLQMYGASVTYGEKQSTSLAFAFLGIAIIGFSYCLIAPA